MTRQEFLAYAFKNNPYNKSLDNMSEAELKYEKWCEENSPLWKPKEKVGFKPYDITKLRSEIPEEYRDKSHPEKVFDFLETVGELDFERAESSSGDVLHFHLVYYAYLSYWNDIKCLVHYIGYVENCADRIIDLCMSENGRFYTSKHDLIAETEEEFFDYLTTVEFDFHPEIKQRTYNMLRYFGWYEGRHIDTTDFEREMRHRGIELTQKQLDFLAEFSGLYFSFDELYYDWWFFTLEEILQERTPDLRTGYEETVTYNGEIIATKVLNCGDKVDVCVPISVDSEGRLLMGSIFYGRNIMESINHLANNTKRDKKWQEIEGGQKME